MMAAPPDKDPNATARPRLRGPERLNEMMRRDRARALYGNSPPPKREPAPYPKGEVISHCLESYVVRHGDTVTKYTTNPNGLGSNDRPNEAEALRFVRDHTTIPVPEVIESDWDRITMTHVEGQTLKDAWPTLTPDERSGVMAQLGDYIAQMRALGGIYLGRLDGQGVMVPSVISRSGGPFRTTAELHDWLVKPPRRLESQSMYWHQITAQLGKDYPVVFTHGDIAARNIIVRGGRIVAILDWEYAGWYPEFWDYVFALRGLDNIDWESLGQRVPSLFADRYDLEYILMEFVVSLS